MRRVCRLDFVLPRLHRTTNTFLGTDASFSLQHCHFCSHHIDDPFIFSTVFPQLFLALQQYKTMFLSQSLFSKGLPHFSLFTKHSTKSCSVVSIIIPITYIFYSAVNASCSFCKSFYQIISSIFHLTFHSCATTSHNANHTSLGLQIFCVWNKTTLTGLPSESSKIKLALKKFRRNLHYWSCISRHLTIFISRELSMLFFNKPLAIRQLIYFSGKREFWIFTTKIRNLLQKSKQGVSNPEVQSSRHTHREDQSTVTTFWCKTVKNWI